MAQLQLVYGGCDYWDRTRPLIDGRVRPEGIDLRYTVVQPADSLGHRMLDKGEFEASEMFMASYIVLCASGDERFVGLPIFPSRNFRHGYVFVRCDAGIERPQDLAGKRVGVGNYAVTASMWVRAFLHHDYGVPPSAIHWFEGSMSAPRNYAGYAKLDLPPEIHVTQVRDKPLEEMLLAGELDALVSPARPRALTEGDLRVRRLFPNYREVERAYFQRTGFFPIMHLVVVRREIYERHPWVAKSLMIAFEEAKALGRRRAQDTGALAVALPWLAADLEEIDELFGGDAFPYGFEANRPIIDAMTQYAYEQGMAKRKVAPEELFPPETLT